MSRRFVLGARTRSHAGCEEAARQLKYLFGLNLEEAYALLGDLQTMKAEPQEVGADVSEAALSGLAIHRGTAQSAHEAQRKLTETP